MGTDVAGCARFDDVTHMASCASTDNEDVYYVPLDALAGSVIST